MKETGGQTLSDALSRLPGVSQLTTGPISKPVVRGLYGNRLQINVCGFRLEDQQWEDEHGLGLSEVGVERVELIKGPAALLFGSDAMGGVINIVEEHFDSVDSRNKVLPYRQMQNLNVELFSNTYGFGVDYGLKKKTRRNNALILRVGAENHADFSDGKGNRVPNTRFAMYNFKAGYIINKGRWTSENRLFTTFNQFGFIKDTTEIAEAATENRWSREFEDEHHNVLYNIGSSNNTFVINDKTTWHVNLGMQSNLRQEQEGEEETELNLFLNTVNLNTTINKQLKNNVLWVNGVAGMAQTNTNLGTRIIVPDAQNIEGAVFSYLKKAWTGERISTHLETGLRYDRRSIQTFRSTPDNGLPVFKRTFETFNGAVGLSLVTENWVIKSDVATGFRPPNLAELASDGLHEGTNRWDQGDPGLKTEQCLNMDISAEYHQQDWTFRGSVFQNYFSNYIYISPTDYYASEIYPIFRYLQTDARFKGLEAGVEWNNERIAQVSIDYSWLNAQKTNGEWLPFSPSNRLLGKTKWYVPLRNDHFQNAYIAFNATFAQAQKHTAIYETSTPEYWLFSLGAGVSYHKIRFLLTCNNLTNTYYNDHLSLLRNIGMRDMGRNVVLNMGFQF